MKIPRKRKLKGIDDELQQLEKRRIELSSQRERLQYLLGKRNWKIWAKAETSRCCSSDLRCLTRGQVVIRNELALLVTAIAGQEFQLSQTKDPNVRALMSLEIGRLSRLSAQYNADFAGN